MIPYTIKPFTPNLITTMTSEIQGMKNKVNSTILKISTFCSLTYGCKTPKTIKPIPVGDMSIPVLVTIAKNNPLIIAGINNA